MKCWIGGTLAYLVLPIAAGITDHLAAHSELETTKSNLTLAYKIILGATVVKDCALGTLTGGGCVFTTLVLMGIDALVLKGSAWLTGHI